MAARHAVRSSVLAALAGLVLAACASTARTWPELSGALGPPEGGLGRLVVYRERGSPDISFRPLIAVDGADLGAVGAGRFVWTDLAPGAHVVSLREDPGDDRQGEHDTAPPLGVAVGAGDTRYVRVRVEVAAEGVAVALDAAEADDAERALAHALREDVP